jgi:hypothetical protein
MKGVAWLVVGMVLCSAIFGGVVQASERRMACHSVIRLSEISLPSKLIPLIISDDVDQSCFFYVSLPPQAAAETSIDQAASMWDTLKEGSKNPGQIIRQVADSKFSSIVIDALLQPLSEDRFQNDRGKTLASLIPNYAGEIEKCTVNTLMLSQPVVTKFDDSFSCGFNKDQSALVLFIASLSGLSIELYLPT